MTPIKRNVSFALEAKKTSPVEVSASRGKGTRAKPEARVRCIVTWNSVRVRLTTGHTVNPDAWNAEVRRCAAKSCHGRAKVPAAAINRDLDDLEMLIDGIFREFEAKDTIPTREEFTVAYRRLTEPGEEAVEADRSIFPVFDLFIEDGIKCGRWGFSTQGVTRTIRKHLHAMKRDLTFDDLERMGVGGLLDYFSTVPDNEKKQGLSNRTILKDMSFIRSFLRWAHENGHCGPIRLAEQRVRLKTAKKPVVFLTWDELMTVYGFDFGVKNYLSQVRDVFCFCCFTSLRYSDVRNLKRANISEAAITITTVKTHDTLTIELNNYSRTILEKYADFKFPQGRALPVITNQKMNEYLKELGRICGLDTPVAVTSYKGASRIDKVYKKWELLSTHAGRRTFVCNALMLGIPPNIVMKWTGHSDYSAMRPYIEIADDAKKSAMSAFDRAGTEPGQKVGQKVGQKSDNG